nr:hypothetical protein [Tanacetum cinerariifolium]
DLRHSRDIIYLSDVSVDCLHQPWRAFATIINKCLSSKETGMDKIHLSRAQILWGQTFEDLPLEYDILSFIRDLRHSRDIIYLSDVSVDRLHQPWRAFATIINKCLSGKETGMDKIHLSRA